MIARVTRRIGHGLAGGEWLGGAVETPLGVYDFEALAFDEPSRFGIDAGRVSKLYIRRAAGGIGDTVYSYDRGLDYDHAPDGMVAAIIRAVAA